MNDKFEEWLKQKIKSNKVVLGRGNKTWGRFEAFTESLEKYQEFKKERNKPKPILKDIWSHKFYPDDTVSQLQKRKIHAPKGDEIR